MIAMNIKTTLAAALATIAIAFTAAALADDHPTPTMVCLCGFPSGKDAAAIHLECITVLSQQTHSLFRCCARETLQCG